jgi:HSF-type DNA-binding
MASSYSDFAASSDIESKYGGTSSNPNGSETNANDDNGSNSNIRNNAAENFPVKLHYMLGELKRDGLDHIVSWQPHGRCFIVHNQKEFEQKILPKYVQ